MYSHELFLVSAVDLWYVW